MNITFKGVAIGFLAGFAVSTVSMSRVQGQAQAPGQAPRGPAVGIVQHMEHVNITTADASKLAKNIADVLGIPVPPERSAKGVFFAKDYPHDPDAYPKFYTFQLPNMNLEIMEPVGGKSPWRDALERNGGVSGFHHLEFDVLNMEDAVARFEAKGAKMSLGNGRAMYAYMESRDMLGFAVELNRVDATGKKISFP